MKKPSEKELELLFAVSLETCVADVESGKQGKSDRYFSLKIGELRNLAFLTTTGVVLFILLQSRQNKHF
jgi:hypothetical protein